MDLLKALQSHRNWCKLLSGRWLFAFCRNGCSNFWELYIDVKQIACLELRFRCRIKQDGALLDIKQCYSMCTRARILFKNTQCFLQTSQTINCSTSYLSVALQPAHSLFRILAWAWWGKPGFVRWKVGGSNILDLRCTVNIQKQVNKP